MDIIPAIDLKGGRCVRLYQGDYSQETVFSEDPLDVALKWQARGAPRLHLVDLDGAAAGEPQNLEIINQIAQALLIPVEVGGGIRDAATVGLLLSSGVERVILGTAAVEDVDFVRQMCKIYRDFIIVGIDARDGYVATRGWLEDTKTRPVDLAHRMVSAGVRRIIYTDISRDGTLTEPNFSAMGELIDILDIPVIASGGVANVNHLKMLSKLGAEGAIVGRAIYTGDVDLKQAIRELDKMNNDIGRNR
ncbi:1-(5-phosphoribosyl)-5-[(5-phosphoribosylamino)methylideneamino]imidazole-4-carboxamide isomerase [Chloroflexota bacterium]